MWDAHCFEEKQGVTREVKVNEDQASEVYWDSLRLVSHASTSPEE